MRRVFLLLHCIAQYYAIGISYDQLIIIISLQPSAGISPGQYLQGARFDVVRKCAFFDREWTLIKVSTIPKPMKPSTILVSVHCVRNGATFHQQYSMHKKYCNIISPQRFSQCKECHGRNHGNAKSTNQPL